MRQLAIDNCWLVLLILAGVAVWGRVWSWRQPSQAQSQAMGREAQRRRLRDDAVREMNRQMRNLGSR